MGGNEQGFYLTNNIEPRDDSHAQHAKDIYGFASVVDPGAVEEAGEAYLTLAGHYDRMTTTIRYVAGEIARAWHDGAGSVEAQRQLAQLFVAAKDMHQAGTDIGNPVKDHGKNALASFKNDIMHGPHASNFKSGKDSKEKVEDDPDTLGNILEDLVHPWTDTTVTKTPAFHATAEARKRLKKHIAKTQKTYSKIPTLMYLDLPPVARKSPPPHRDPYHTGPPPYDSTASTGAPYGRNLAGLPSNGSTPPTGHDGNGSIPGYPGSNGNNGLPGSGHPGSGLPGSGFPGSGTSLAGSPPGNGLPVGGPSGGSIPGGIPGGGFPGSVGGNGVGSAPVAASPGRFVGAGESSPGAAVPGAPGRGGGMNGMPIMPMAAGGPGQEGEERERMAYQLDEDKIFAAEDSVAPPVIGG